MGHISEAAEQHAAGDWAVMPSGAGHDAQRIAEVMPSAMLFVPSINGLSHNFDEDTSERDLILGCQVYTDAAAAMLLDAHEKVAQSGGWDRQVTVHDPWRPRPNATTPVTGAPLVSNAPVVEEDAFTLAAIELAFAVPAVRELLEAEVSLAVAALGETDQGGNLPIKYSKEFKVPPSLREIFPEEVQTIRVFGLQEGAVMSVYERHPNSTQRTRVVVGEGTWHVRRADGGWYHDTIAAASLDAISTEGGLVAHTHVVPPDALHFVENRSGKQGGIHVNLTWHSAAQVEDVIVRWEEDSVEAEGIDSYHIEKGFHETAVAAKL